MARRFKSTDPTGKKSPWKRATPRPPAGRRTPASSALVKVELVPPDPDAAGWARRAYRLALALHDALGDEHIDESTRAAIERAFAAFELGYTDTQIARVAHLVESARDAIRETQRRELERAYRDCAGVLEQALYPVLRRHVAFDELVQLVRQLRMEASAQVAITEGVSDLLGWNETARLHASAAIRAALAAQRIADSDPED